MMASAKHQPQTFPAAMRIPFAGVLAWVFPGLGHLFVGDRTRAIILMVTISLTFWCGVAVGGVRITVNPEQNRLWFMAQICSGAHALVAYGWGEHERNELIGGYVAEHPDQLRAIGLDVRNPGARLQLERRLLATAHWPAIEVALVYTGVAGLLNLLAVMDALVRAEKSLSVSPAGGKSRGGT